MITITLITPAAVAAGSLEPATVTIAIITLIALVVTWAINRISIMRIKKGVDESREVQAVMQHTLDTLHNQVISIDPRDRRAYNLHGSFLPGEAVTLDAFLTYIHPDDTRSWQAFIEPLLQGQVTTDECTFRWDSSLDLHLSHWRYIKKSANYCYVRKYFPI